MYARVVKVEVNPAQRDETKRIFTDVINSGRDVDGFEGAMLLIDPETGKGMSLTLWESEQAMLAAEQSDWWQTQIERLKNAFIGPPVREHYVVAFSALPGALSGDEPKIVERENELRLG
jgi:heme-degrading monooxygenase HmoA